MRIDFSEPECSNCFHCRMLNTQEPEPSNVIASFELVNSEPVQALEDDSAAVGSTSTSSPVQTLEDNSAAVGSMSTSSPIQTLGHDSTAVGSTSTSTLSPVQSLGHESSAAVGSTSTSSPIQTHGHDSAAAVGSISTSSPVQAYGHDPAATGCVSSFCWRSKTPSAPPVITSFFSGPVPTLAAPTPASLFGSAPAVTSVSSAPTPSFGQNTSAFGCSPNSFGFTPAVTSVSSAPPTPAFGQNTSAFGSSPHCFGFTPAVTSVSSAPTPAFGQTSLFGPKPAGNFGCSLFAAHTQPGFVSTQAPVAATFGSGASGTSPSPGFLPFGSIPPPPTNPSSLFASTQDHHRTGTTYWNHPSTSNPFGQNIPIPPTGTIPAPPTNASSLFGPTPNSPWTSFGGSVFSAFASPKTSPPQPFAPFSNNPHTGFNPFRTIEGDTGGMFMSVSASTHPYKSHEELRWEDYQKANKGTKTNTLFGTPPLFASPSVPLHPQRPNFGTPTAPAFSFSQHNAALTGFGTPSSPASGCTACGATTSTSASSSNWTFNGATFAPPSAATTSLPGLFYPMYGSVPMMMFGASPAAQVTGSVPMMFGTSPAAQVTTPALQAYPVNGYILLPFAAMNLH